jgi:hypothetical protein
VTASNVNGVLREEGLKIPRSTSGSQGARLRALEDKVAAMQNVESELRADIAALRKDFESYLSGATETPPPSIRTTGFAKPRG